MNRQGTFLHIPYDWRRPTKSRIRRAFWNPSDPHLFVPHVFGWGYTINFARLFRRR